MKLLPAKKKHLGVLFGFAPLIMGLLLYSCDSKSGHLAIGRQAPNFSYLGLDGETRELKELRGNVVFLRFWADWCPYCETEMQMIDKIYMESKEKGFIVLAVNVKQSEAKVRAYVEKYNLSFPMALDPKGKIADKFQVRGLPMNFLINREGILKEFIIGAISDVEMLREYLEPYSIL